jgi:hypothetical protein
VVDTDEGALTEARAAVLLAGGHDALSRFRVLIEGAASEGAGEGHELNEEELTFLNKSVNSGHAISPEAIIFWSVFNRRRAVTCM